MVYLQTKYTYKYIPTLFYNVVIVENNFHKCFSCNWDYKVDLRLTF